jgi:hypothetical protein
MGQVIGSIENEPDRSVEIVVHITETLEQQQRGNLVAALENDGGIVSAEFCPLRFHLMLVRYNKDMYSSQDVLSRVKSQNIDAQLVGPV